MFMLSGCGALLEYLAEDEMTDSQLYDKYTHSVLDLGLNLNRYGYMFVKMVSYRLQRLHPGKAVTIINYRWEMTKISSDTKLNAIFI